MLRFNPHRIFALRGINSPTAFLVNLGFRYPQASKFLKGSYEMVKTRHVEKLCVALNCTPNDLYEWTPDAKTVLPESHSLNRLDKGAGMKQMRDLLKDIPSDKLELIAGLLEELKR
jgi:DNA-binding Xre family transcriptional regulator